MRQSIALHYQVERQQEQQRRAMMDAVAAASTVRNRITQAEERIAHMARHDALTDLPNRVLLLEQLNHEIKRVKRGECLAVLCLDTEMQGYVFSRARPAHEIRRFFAQTPARKAGAA